MRAAGPRYFCFSFLTFFGLQTWSLSSVFAPHFLHLYLASSLSTSDLPFRHFPTAHSFPRRWSRRRTPVRIPKTRRCGQRAPFRFRGPPVPRRRRAPTATDGVPAGPLAAIDVGTNTIRCIVAEAAPGDFRVLDDERAVVRLGEGLSATGEISPAAWERAREALERMRKIAEGLGATVIEAVATSAVRRASNGAEFVAAMERDAGVRLRVISGEEEAELAALSARHHFEMANTRYALLDLGGGSVEVVTAVGEHIEGIRSLELGAVVLTERFCRRDPLPARDLERLRKHVRKQLRRHLPVEDFVPQMCVGSGGTVTTLGAMAMALRNERYGSVHGYEVMRSEIVHLLAMLSRKTQKERRSVAGLGPDRADIIVAGVAVVDLVMEHLGVNVLTVNERGIREGLILKSLEKHGLRAAAERRDWRGSLEDFARSCHVDWPHAAQVRDLAGQLFDAVAEPFGLDGRARELLEAAAVLHDVGYFIDYARHHKHTYHLIRHAELLGFTPREKEIVANVARYHRKALPKKKHEGFGRLETADRVLVLRLGGILRLADGLDRRRNGLVRSLRCRLADGRLQVTLAGEEDLSVEVYGGQEKGDLFERAFRTRLELGAQPSSPAG
ncbi:MAG: Ppx/GppA family phosphatase [Proteobacteria bacterium]|nr:Ppx/GppA family phosphatase [Pseudomonadota bacterium]